jgi:hypothetical protein
MNKARRNTLIMSSVICFTNLPEAGSLAVYILNEQKYEIANQNHPKLHNEEIIDGEFFDSRVF